MMQLPVLSLPRVTLNPDVHSAADPIRIHRVQAILAR